MSGIFGFGIKLKGLLLIMFFLVVCSYYIQGQQAIRERPRVGLVLSGGGAKGLADIGALKVLEEAGIPIDYIAGTSIGSIVGGLYAIGYSASQLDSIARTADWDDLLTDRISRRKLSMNEKDEYVQYIVSFPIRGKRIGLPNGLVAGQNISRLFSSLTAPVYNIRDFSKFPIPFLCVATDIEKGEAVVLKKGDLGEAMRASMAIPTIFTPEKIGNRLLVDGGLMDNFPVEEVKYMGANIIIGVDVGFHYLKGNELNSLVKIIEQSIFMHSREQVRKSRKMCNILITPDMSGFNATSFNHADTLIGRGEKAARQQYARLDSLAAYLRSFHDTLHETHREIKKIDTFFIDKVQIHGLDKVPKDFFLRKLPFEVPGIATEQEIQDFIDKMYGTMFFERITYSLNPEKAGVRLVFNVIEKNTNYFRVGLHYDPIFKASLLLNTTFRNVLYRGSKISINLSLGESPSFSALVYKNTGWDPRYGFLMHSRLIPDFGFEAKGHRYEVFEFVNDHRVASYNFSDLTTDFFLQSNISNNNCIGVGALGDLTYLSGRVGANVTSSEEAYFLNLHAFYKHDSYDQACFPSRGSQVTAVAKYVTGLSDNERSLKSFLMASVRSRTVIPLGKKLYLDQGITVAFTFTDTVPDQYKYYLGGMGQTSVRGFIPFVGMNFMQRASLNAIVERLDLRWEMWKDNYLTLQVNAGKAVTNRSEFFNSSDMLWGGGISFGYRSPIGPMELTLMSANKNRGLSAFINIGYSF